MTDRFPGYLAENNTPQRKTEYDLSRADDAQRMVQTYRALQAVLPILVKKAQDIAKPVEMPKRFGGADVIAGWVIDEVYTSAGNGDKTGTNQSAGRSPSVLTESGKFGYASYVDRGIEAIKFYRKPADLSPTNSALGSLVVAHQQLAPYFEEVGVDLSAL